MSVLRRLVLFLLVISIPSCGKKSEYGNLEEYQVEMTQLDYLINNRNFSEEPNYFSDISILNNEYPIEVFLYKDKKWFYNLPNLGTGQGTWEYTDGKILLKAKRSLFTMEINVVASKKDASQISLKFNDRFGLNFLETEINKN